LCYSKERKEVFMPDLRAKFRKRIEHQSQSHEPSKEPESVGERFVELDPDFDPELREPLPAPAPEPKGTTIEQLRDKIAEIMQRDHDVDAGNEPHTGELPFVKITTSEGPLYQRVHTYSPAQRVGCGALIEACDLDLPLLAALADEPRLQTADPARFLYIDTETTGIRRGMGTTPFLFGMGRFEPGSRAMVLEQVMAARLGQETPMLVRLHACAEQASAYVSFNGKSFDLPMLQQRMVLHRLPALPDLPHIDLLRMARRVHQYRLAAKDLAALEQDVLGYQREIDVPSGQVTAHYRMFLQHGVESALLGVMDHNAWDVLSLAALLGLYGNAGHGLDYLDCLGIASVLVKQKQWAASRTWIEQSLAAQPSYRGWMVQAQWAKKQKQFQMLAYALEQAHELLPEPETRKQMAIVYERYLKDYGQALMWTVQGTGESRDKSKRRCERLRKKLAPRPAKKPRKKGKESSSFVAEMSK
jgi:uncharacterized protein